MSVTTVKPIKLAGVPEPIHRFSSDLSTVMGNRPSTFGESGLGPTGGGDDGSGGGSHAASVIMEDGSYILLETGSSLSILLE